MSDFDAAAAHRYFSAHCFNAAWNFIEKTDRSAADDEMMLALSQASIFHWRSRADCQDQNLSIGYWQLSRIYALLNNGQEAHKYAQLCLTYCQDLEPFYRGYAYEALARAASSMKDGERARQFLEEAEACAAQIEDEESRESLLKDLRTLQ